MEIGPWIFAIAGFSLPAIVFYLAFREASRIRRPVEANILYAVMALVLTGAAIHALVLIFLFVLDLPSLREADVGTLVSLRAYRLLSAEALVRQASAIVTANGASAAAIEQALSHFTAYLAATSGFSMAAGMICAKLCIWGVWPFTGFKSYYGGLYELYRGLYYQPVEASVMSKQVIGENKFVVYRGVLEEIRLTPSGTVDHIFISLPQKLVVTYYQNLGNIKGGKSQFIDVDSMEDDEDYTGNRLHIEGADIANIFYRRLDHYVIQNGLDYRLGRAAEWFRSLSSRDETPT